MIERSEELCKYNHGTCPNKRAIRQNGRVMLRVCEFHRRRANAHQKKYQRKKKQSQTTPSRSARSDAASAPLVVVVLANDKTTLEAKEQVHVNELSIGEPYHVLTREQLKGYLSDLKLSTIKSTSTSRPSTVDIKDVDLFSVEDTTTSHDPLPASGWLEDLEQLDSPSNPFLSLDDVNLMNEWIPELFPLSIT